MAGKVPSRPGIEPSFFPARDWAKIPKCEGVRWASTQRYRPFYYAPVNFRQSSSNWPLSCGSSFYEVPLLKIAPLCSI
jgi:hypothetical protein